VLFRHLFQYKYAAMELCAAWQGLGRLLMQRQRAAGDQEPGMDKAQAAAGMLLLRTVGYKLLYLVQVGAAGQAPGTCSSSRAAHGAAAAALQGEEPS
jgi:hypothetical protein